MKYDINLKNIKQSVTNLGEYLKEYNIPHNKLLEGFSKALFHKNWNTLQGLVKKPQVIKQLSVERKYLFEIDVNTNRENLLDLLKVSFSEAKAHLELSNFLEDGQSFHIELNLAKSDKNILTAMFLFAEKLKKYEVKRFDYCRVICEKESFMAMYQR